MFDVARKQDVFFSLFSHANKQEAEAVLKDFD